MALGVKNQSFGVLKHNSKIGVDAVYLYDSYNIALSYITDMSYQYTLFFQPKFVFNQKYEENLMLADFTGQLKGTSRMCAVL